MPETIPLDRDGLRVTLTAGDEVDLRLPFENEGDSPCAYAGRVEGPGAAFATPENGRIALGGHSRGAFVARFAAPAAGDYELTLSVFEEDYLAEPLRSRKVALVVESVAAPDEPPLPVEEPPVPEVKPDPVKSPIPFVEPVPEEAAEVEEAPVTPPSEPPSAVMPKAKKARVVVETSTPPPVAPEPVVVPFKTEPSAKPKVEPPKPRVIVEMGEAAPANVPAPTPLRREPLYDVKSYAPHVLRNPKTGDVLELAPNGRALVLLEFENKGADEFTYVLMVKDDLRPAEDFAYARTIVEQINIRPGGKDELAFEIRIPENAPPQTLRLRVTHGRKEVEPKEVTRLTLKVSPRIAVGLGLGAAKPKVVVGPLNRTPEMRLEVTNAGNVDTAYRLTAKGTSGVAADALPGEYPDIEARDGCHYLFDKELEDVRQNGKVPASLRFFRPGIWWLGWWQTARLKAVAVPVTDPRNAGVAGNAVDLVATRWRLLPLPWFLAVPLLLLFFALFVGGFGVGDVRVDNAVCGDEGICFVLQPASEFKDDPSKPMLPITARLSWSAPPLSWLTVIAPAEGAQPRVTGFGSAVVKQTIREGDFEETDRLRVTSVFRLGGQDTPRVVYLPMRTKGAFQPEFSYIGPREVKEGEIAEGKSGQAVPPLHQFSEIGDKVSRKVNGTTVEALEVSVTLAPSDKLYITPTNKGTANDVKVWRLINPKYYDVGNLNKNSRTDVAVGSEKRWVLQPSYSAPAEGTDHFWFLTTDSGSQVVHIIINRQKGGAQ